jgi:hypothetical protein
MSDYVVMVKEQGLRNTVLMVGFILAYAISVGAVLNGLFQVLGVSL